MLMALKKKEVGEEKERKSFFAPTKLQVGTKGRESRRKGGVTTQGLINGCHAVEISTRGRTKYRSQGSRGGKSAGRARWAAIETTCEGMC